MKAIFKESPKSGFVFKDVPMPEISDHDLLLEVTAASICGTDVHIYDFDEWAQKAVKTPLIPGHEFCGRIVEVGKNVTNFKVGQRVSGEGHVTCGVCRNCRSEKRHLCLKVEGIGISRHGAFAEYVSIPAQNAFLLPDEVSDEVASMLDPLGNAIHTALSHPLAGEDVLITGAGPIGAMAAAVCRYVGARRIIVSDLHEYRLEIAKKMGATHCFNVSKKSLHEQISELKMDEGIDFVLEMSGSPYALNDAIELIRPGGGICLLGILPAQAAINWQDVIFKGLNLQGIYGRKMFDTWYRMVAMLSQGLDVNAVLTHRFHFSDFEKAFQTMKSGNCGKVVFSWNK